MIEVSINKNRNSNGKRSLEKYSDVDFLNRRKLSCNVLVDIFEAEYIFSNLISNDDNKVNNVDNVNYSKRPKTVFIFKLKLNDSKSEVTLQKIETLLKLINNNISNNTFINKSYEEKNNIKILQPIGYIYNQETDSFSIIYNKDSEIIPVELNKLKNLEDLNMILKLDIIHNIITYTKECHKNQHNMGFLHPDLFLLSKQGFITFDFISLDLTDFIDFNDSYYYYSYFFGFYNIDNNINNINVDTNTNSVNNNEKMKTIYNDIFSIFLIMIYYFSTSDTTSTSLPLQVLEFNKVVSLLKKDLLFKAKYDRINNKTSNNTSNKLSNKSNNSNKISIQKRFENLLSKIKDKMVLDFLTEQLNLCIENNIDIHLLHKNFKKFKDIVINEPDNYSCNCNDDNDDDNNNDENSDIHIDKNSNDIEIDIQDNKDNNANKNYFKIVENNLKSKYILLNPNNNSNNLYTNSKSYNTFTCDLLRGSNNKNNDISTNKQKINYDTYLDKLCMVHDKIIYFNIFKFIENNDNNPQKLFQEIKKKAYNLLELSNIISQPTRLNDNINPFYQNYVINKFSHMKVEYGKISRTINLYNQKIKLMMMFIEYLLNQYQAFRKNKIQIFEKFLDTILVKLGNIQSIQQRELHRKKSSQNIEPLIVTRRSSKSLSKVHTYNENTNLINDKKEISRVNSKNSELHNKSIKSLRSINKSSLKESDLCSRDKEKDRDHSHSQGLYKKLSFPQTIEINEEKTMLNGEKLAQRRKLELNLNKFEKYVFMCIANKSNLNQDDKINRDINTIRINSLIYYNSLENNIKRLKESYENISQKILEKLYSEKDYFENNPIYMESSHINPYNEYFATVDIRKNNIRMFSMTELRQKPKKEQIAVNINLITYDHIPISLNQFCRWVNMKTRFIVCGGVNELNEPQSTVFYINYNITEQENLLIDDVVDGIEKSKTRIIMELPDMIVPRDQHAIIAVEDFYLVCCGGNKTNECELFNFLTNKWEMLPPLNFRRFNGTLFLYNGKDLYYLFGLISDGASDYSFSSSIQKLKLFNGLKLNNEWIVIKLKQKFKFEICLNTILSIKQGEILILGGRTSKNKTSNECLSLNLENYELTHNKTKNLSKGLCFLESNFIKVGNNDYLVYASDLSLVKMFNVLLE